jgi:mRNA-degrading endonuclease RelE of RelBE toxin-antitoxin system
MDNLIIKTTPAFDRESKGLITKESLEDLYSYLEKNPTKGSIISGTGGVRKLRWLTGKDNKGKSGGVRVLYHYSNNILVLLITIYGKSEKENVTQAECNELKRLVPKLIAKYAEDL